MRKPTSIDGSCINVGAPCDDGDATTFDDIYTDCSLPDFGCVGTPGPPTTPEGPILYRAAFHTSGAAIRISMAPWTAQQLRVRSEWTLVAPAAATDAMWTEAFQSDTVLAVRDTDGLVTWTSQGSRRARR